MTESDPGRKVPTDSFRVRLAIVRAEMGWNYEEAQAATGVGKESWRLWEKGERHCSDVPGVSRKIAAVTNYDLVWLVVGGPLVPEEEAAPRPHRVRSIGGYRPSTRRVKARSTDGCMTSTRRATSHRAVNCEPLAA